MFRWAGSSQVQAWLADDLVQLATRLQQVEREIAAVLATLPAGVHGHAKAAAAYAGVHPRQAQSGQRDRSALSTQGCPALRRYLYLAAMCAVRCDPTLAAWYRALCARGKAPQSAIWAVAHKLLRQMMGRLRQARGERVARTEVFAYAA
jgi:transposase